MKKYLIVLLAVLLVPGASYAGKKDPLKIALLSVTTNRIVGSGEGLGALETLSEDLTEEDLDTYAGIDFGEINDHAIQEYTKELGDLKWVEIVPLSEYEDSETFNALKEKIKKSNERYPFLEKRLKTTHNMPHLNTMLWIVKKTSDEQKKYLAEVAAAVKEFCEKTGADAVWIQQNSPGYRTKGLSRLMSPVTKGSGRGIATVGINYVLLDSNGEKIVGKMNLKDGKSDGKFWMKLGKAKMDEKMMGFLKEAVTNSAEEIADDVKKPIKKAWKKKKKNKK